MKRNIILSMVVVLCANLQAEDAVINKVAYNLNQTSLTAEVTNCTQLPGQNKGVKNEGDVVIPEKVNFRGVSYVVNAIGMVAYSKSSISSITIPNSVTYIGESAFEGCKNLNSVNMASSVTTIEKRAFANCPNLKEIIISEECDFIGDCAFAWSGLENVTIGPKLASIGSKIFYKSKLQTVNYPSDADLSELAIPSYVQLLAYDSQNTPYRSNVTPNSHQDLAAKTVESNIQEVQNNTISRKPSEVDVNIPIIRTTSSTTFVIIFANEDYKNVASVPFAKNDGIIFQKYCQRTLGIPSSNIHYVENASFNDIRIQLAWLKDVCDAYEGSASVIVYYAGHGIPDETTKSAYLLPVDGDGRYVQSAYKVDDFYEKLGGMNAKKITVFMDACFSGSKREDGMLASARGVALKAKSGVPQGNMVVFSAAQGDETAYPNTDEQHGIFTYYLLKKLQETKGEVTLQELGDYISQNVRQQSIVKNGKKQTPCVTPSAAVGSEWQNWKLK